MQKFAPDYVSIEDNGQIIIPVMVNGKSAKFLLYTASTWSKIQAPIVLGIRRIHAPAIMASNEGINLTEYVTVRDFKIGNVSMPDTDFYIIPNAKYSEQFDGTIGVNFLKKLDLELDYNNKIVNFFIPSDCGERVVY